MSKSSASKHSAHQILLKGKKLRTTEDYQKVYISPNRSLKERNCHKEMVAEMRRQAKEDPTDISFCVAEQLVVEIRIKFKLVFI